MGLAADLLALFHGLVIVPTAVAGPIVLWLARRRLIWLEWLFLIFGGFTALSFLIFEVCLFTSWEQGLRLAAGEPSYTGGFVSHYLGLIGVKISDQITFITGTVLITAGGLRLLLRLKWR